MQIEIVNRNLAGDPSAVARAKERARSILSRLARRVDRVVVKVEALAGRAGMHSRECLVLVRLRGGDEVVVRKRGEGVFDLVYSALRQARAAARKRLDRRRSRNGGR